MSRTYPWIGDRVVCTHPNAKDLLGLDRPRGVVTGAILDSEKGPCHRVEFDCGITEIVGIEWLEFEPKERP